MYAILLSRAWDHVGSQTKIRKGFEGLNLESESYFIRPRIPQRHASDLRNFQGLNPEVLESYNINCPYSRKAAAHHCSGKLSGQHYSNISAPIDGAQTRASVYRKALFEHQCPQSTALRQERVRQQWGETNHDEKASVHDVEVIHWSIMWGNRLCTMGSFAINSLSRIPDVILR